MINSLEPLPDNITSDAKWHGKHNCMAVAPIWQEYNWQDILINGIENVKEGTVVAKADNVVLKNGVSGELKIDVLFNHLVDNNFMRHKIKPEFLGENGLSKIYTTDLFEKGNRCLILQLSHGDVKETITLELPCGNNTTKLEKSNSLELHELLLYNTQELADYFRGTGIGHIAMNFVKQIALHEGLTIRLSSLTEAVGFYEKEQFEATYPDHSKMHWDR